MSSISLFCDDDSDMERVFNCCVMLERALWGRSGRKLVESVLERKIFSAVLLECLGVVIPKAPHEPA